MFDYTSVFMKLFEELKESDLERNTKIVFKDKNDHVCVGHVIFNDNEVHWRISSNKFCSIKIVDNKVCLIYGLSNSMYDEYDLNELVNKDDEVKKICDYFVEATCGLLTKNKDILNEDTTIDLNEVRNKLKGLLQDKISIGSLGKNKDTLTGVYLHNPDQDNLNHGIDFTITYNENNLVLYIEDQSFIDGLDIACKLGLVISSIISNNILIGNPTKSYINQNIPCFIWDLNNRKQNNLIDDVKIEYLIDKQRDEQNLSKILTKREYISININK